MLGLKRGAIEIDYSGLSDCTKERFKEKYNL